jgi:hypothetical protein
MYYYRQYGGEPETIVTIYYRQLYTQAMGSFTNEFKIDMDTDSLYNLILELCESDENNINVKPHTFYNTIVKKERNKINIYSDIERTTDDIEVADIRLLIIHIIDELALYKEEDEDEDDDYEFYDAIDYPDIASVAG